MKKLLVCTLATLALYSCNNSKERVEEKMMECSNLSMNSSGKSLLDAVNEYEKLLLDEGILKDASGNSYYQLYKKLAKGEPLDKLPSKSFSEMIGDNTLVDPAKAQQCTDAIKTDSLKYDWVKFDSIQKVYESIHTSSGQISIEEINEKITNILAPEDFELSFYKTQVFHLLTMVITQEQMMAE